MSVSCSLKLQTMKLPLELLIIVLDAFKPVATTVQIHFKSLHKEATCRKITLWEINTVSLPFYQITNGLRL